MTQNSVEKLIHMMAWEAAHSRMGEVMISVDECHICKQVKPTIYIDGSEGEYGSIDICQGCISDLFKSWADRISRETGGAK